MYNKGEGRGLNKIWMRISKKTAKELTTLLEWLKIW